MTTVSLQTIAALFGSEEKLIAPVITQSSDDGTSILSFVLTAEGEIPEDGLIVTVNSDIQVGNDGLYNWDVTSLIQRWAVDPTNNDGVAISGFYGNVDIDGRNSYGIFHTVGSTTGQLPILTIKTLGGGSSSPQTLYGTSVSETLAGGQANDTIYGNGGEDFLNGRAGNDLIYGGSGADTIVGGSGDDVIYANGGSDLINAGSGMDTVWLGGGAATIVLNEGEGYVTVKNFQLGETRFKGAGSGLSFADSADGVKISKGDDLLAVVPWQTASTFRENASMIFA